MEQCVKDEPEIEQKPTPDDPWWNSVGRARRSVPSTHDRDSGAMAGDRDKAHLPPVGQSKLVLAGVSHA